MGTAPSAPHRGGDAATTAARDAVLGNPDLAALVASHAPPSDRLALALASPLLAAAVRASGRPLVTPLSALAHGARPEWAERALGVPRDLPAAFVCMQQAGGPLLPAHARRRVRSVEAARWLYESTAGEAATAVGLQRALAEAAAGSLEGGEWAACVAVSRHLLALQPPALPPVARCRAQAGLVLAAVKLGRSQIARGEKAPFEVFPVLKECARALEAGSQEVKSAIKVEKERFIFLLQQHGWEFAMQEMQECEESMLTLHEATAVLKRGNDGMREMLAEFGDDPDL